MSEALPALSLVAVPGRRRITLDLAAEAERRGFSGLYVPSMFGNMAQSTALALATERIAFATAISPIYARTVEDFAQSAAFIHEVSGGRFRFGIGVAHAPSHLRMGVTVGKPLADIRAFVARFRAHEGFGVLPPIILAALRKGMVALAGEIADGLVFANASRSHMAESLAVLTAEKRCDPGFSRRQHDPNLHLGRRRGGEGGQPPHADPLHDAAELPQLLEGSRLCRGDGGDRGGRRGRRGRLRGRHPRADERPLAGR